MKPALALTLVSSITCLWTLEAEARPSLVAHPHGAATRVDDKPAAKPKPVAKAAKGKHDKVAHEKGGHDKPGHDKGNKPHAAAHKGHEVNAAIKVHDLIPPVAWKVGDEPSITVQAKVTPAAHAKATPAVQAKVAPHERPFTSVAHFHAGASKAKAGGGKAGPASKKAPPKASFWLAAEPHVPLAVIDGPAIHSVPLGPKSCGAEKRWAKPKSHWKAVNEWGQVAGSFEVSRSEGLDNQQCREVFFKGEVGSQPRVLFVSEESGWKPSASVAWTPSEGEVKHYEHLMGAIDETWINDKPKGKLAPLGKRTLFFTLPAAEDAGVKRPTHWAVSGGPVLVVAYLGEHGHWKASEVKAPLGIADGYKPVGVFDMNGDGVPEIVYHLSDGPNDADAVLSLDLATMSWADAAMSPGGSTR